MGEQLQPGERPRSPSGADADAARPGVRVLVVEDEADTAETTAILFRMVGHTVEVVGDGLAALRAAAANPPDVVLLDIGLRGMNGYEVARQLRGQPAGQKTVIIAVTGYAQESDRRRSREAGVDLHLVKPVDSSLLAQAVGRFHRPVAAEAGAAADTGTPP